MLKIFEWLHLSILTVINEDSRDFVCDCEIAMYNEYFFIHQNFYLFCKKTIFENLLRRHNITFAINI